MRLVSGALIKKGWNEDIANEKPYKEESVPLNELNRVEEEKKSACVKNEGLSAVGHSVDLGNALSMSTMSKSCQDSMGIVSLGNLLDINIFFRQSLY